MKRPSLLVGERKDNESDRAVQACNDYLRLGPARSLPKLLASHHRKKPTKTDQNRPITESLGTLKEWSTEFEWQLRASAYDAELEAEKNEKRRQVFEQGLALDYERVTKLKRLASFLEKQILDEIQAPTYASTEDAIDVALSGNAPYAPPPGFENYKVWLPDVKQIGSGEDATRVDIVRFNAALISEFRAALDDLAKETGGRRQKVDHLISNLDYRRLTDDQIDRIDAGEDPVKVILSAYTSANQGQG